MSVDEIATKLTVEVDELNSDLVSVERQAEKSLGEKGAAGSAVRFSERLRRTKTDTEKLQEQIARLDKQSAFAKVKAESVEYQAAMARNKAATEQLNNGLVSTARGAAQAGVSINGLRGGMQALASPMAGLAAGGASFQAVAGGASSLAAALGPVGIAVGAGIAAFSLLEPVLSEFFAEVTTGTPIVDVFTRSIDLQRLGVKDLDDALKSIAKDGLRDFVKEQTSANRVMADFVEGRRQARQAIKDQLATEIEYGRERKAADIEAAKGAEKAALLRAELFAKFGDRSALGIAGDRIDVTQDDLVKTYDAVNALREARAALAADVALAPLAVRGKTDADREIAEIDAEIKSIETLRNTMRESQEIATAASDQRAKDIKDHKANAGAIDKEAAAQERLVKAQLSLLVTRPKTAPNPFARGAAAGAAGPTQGTVAESAGLWSSVGSMASGVGSGASDMASGLDSMIDDLRAAQEEYNAIVGQMASTLQSTLGAAFVSVAVDGGSMFDAILTGMGGLITELVPALITLNMAEMALFSGQWWAATGLLVAALAAGAALTKAGTPSSGGPKGASGGGGSQAVERAITRASERDAQVTNVSVYLNGKVDKMFDVVEDEAVRRGYARRGIA